MVFAPKFNISYISLLQSELEEHVRHFSQLFPEKSVKPKHHFALHYPVHILNYGPPVSYYCFRFEAKHSYFKKVIQHSKQFKIVLKSLAVRH